MSKARTLADFISDGSEFADGTISVAEVSGAAPLASPSFTGTLYMPQWIEHSGDSNTYFGFPGGDEFKIVAAAVGRLHMTGSQTVFTEGGEDRDFRVESTSNSHMLFVDAGADHVNIGTGTDLGGTLNVNGKVVVSYSDPAIASLTIEDTGTSQAGLNLKAGSGSTNRATRINFFNNVTSSSTPRWSILNDYYQNGDNGFWVADSVGNKFLTLTSNQAEPGSGSFIVNEDSDDINFRVESDTNNAAIHVDGSLSVVGINTSNASSYTTSNSLAIKGRDVAMIGGASSGSLATQLRFFNDQGTPYEIAGLKINVGAGQVNRGQWQFLTNNGAGNRQWLDVDYSGNVTFNEAGNSSDFRVESDQNAHALFVDALNSRIGFFNAAPSAPLHLIAGTPSTFTDAFQIGDGSYTNIAMYSGAADGEIRIGAAGALRGSYKAQYAGTRSAHDFSVGANNISAITFDSGGPVKVNAGANSLIDFRVASSTYSHMLFVDAGADVVSVGSVNTTLGSGLSVTPTATYGNTVTHRAADGIGGSGQRANMTSGILTIETTSSGNQLTIPVTYSGSFWAQYYVRLVVVSAEYNLSAGKAGEATFTFGAATSIANLTTLSTTGNISSIARVNASNPNPHTLQINFASGYTSGLNNWEGIQLYYEIVSSWPDRMQMQNAALN